MSFAGNRNPCRQGAALRLKMSARRFALKDAAYLAGENCTHIARITAVKIFLFIFSNL
jgi:hypothetical protein